MHVYVLLDRSKSMGRSLVVDIRRIDVARSLVALIARKLLGYSRESGERVRVHLYTSPGIIEDIEWDEVDSFLLRNEYSVKRLEEELKNIPVGGTAFLVKALREILSDALRGAAVLVVSDGGFALSGSDRELVKDMSTDIRDKRLKLVFVIINNRLSPDVSTLVNELGARLVQFYSWQAIGSSGVEEVAEEVVKYLLKDVEEYSFERSWRSRAI